MFIHQRECSLMYERQVSGIRERDLASLYSAQPEMFLLKPVLFISFIKSRLQVIV